jgi:hypothetical protein
MRQRLAALAKEASATTPSRSLPRRRIAETFPTDADGGGNRGHQLLDAAAAMLHGRQHLRFWRG